MDSLLKSDIFFFVTTIAVIVVALFHVVAGCYVALILRDLRSLARRAREEGEEILADVEELREEARSEGHPLRALLRFLLSLSPRRRIRARKK